MAKGDASTLLMTIHVANAPSMVVGVSQMGRNGIDSLIRKNLIQIEYRANDFLQVDDSDVKVEIIRFKKDVIDFDIKENTRVCIIWAYPGCDTDALDLQPFSFDSFMQTRSKFKQCAVKNRLVWQRILKKDYFGMCQHALKKIQDS